MPRPETRLSASTPRMRFVYMRFVYMRFVYMTSVYMRCVFMRSIFRCSVWFRAAATLAFLAAPLMCPLSGWANEANNSSGTQLPALTSADIALDVSRSGGFKALSKQERERVLNRFRCQCKDSVTVRAVLQPSALEKLESRTVEASILFGKSCGNELTRSGCLSVEDGVLGLGRDRLETSVDVAALFDQVGADADCNLRSTTTHAFWLVLSQDAKQLEPAFSTALTFNGQRPDSPEIEEVISGDGTLAIKL